MKTASRYFSLFVLTALCTVIFPLAASAKISIQWHGEHVYLYPGRLEFVGYFENTGDEKGYVTRCEFDLFLTASDTGKTLWKTYGNQHYVNSLRVPAHRRVSYTINIRNAHIPAGYKGRYHWSLKNIVTAWTRNPG